MTIKKIRGLESNFSILPNSVVNDNLSWAAKGMLAYLLSKPEGWEVSVQQLINHSALSSRPTKRDGTYAIINELMDHGYMMRERTSGGGYSKTNYIVSSIPEFARKPLTDNPDTVETTQERKVFNKEKNTKHVSTETRYTVDEIDFIQMNYCVEAIRVLVQMKSDGMKNLYTGKLTMDQWNSCQAKLEQAVLDESGIDDLLRLIYNSRNMSKKKNVSLPFMMMEFADNETFSKIIDNL